MYVAQVRIDSSPTHIMYFNNETKEITYGINTGENLESDIAELTDKIDEALEKVKSTSTIVTDIAENKNAIDLINTQHVQRITLNDNNALEIESVTGQFITNTAITIPTLDNITTIEDRLSAIEERLSTLESS